MHIPALQGETSSEDREARVLAAIKRRKRSQPEGGGEGQPPQRPRAVATLGVRHLIPPDMGTGAAEAFEAAVLASVRHPPDGNGSLVLVLGTESCQFCGLEETAFRTVSCNQKARTSASATIFLHAVDVPKTGARDGRVVQGAGPLGDGRRRQLLPTVSSSQRCGHCRSCLNRAMKKVQSRPPPSEAYAVFTRVCPLRD